jgi:hypothetical protein
MLESLLGGLLKVGGITALVMGIFYLLYRQILALRIFTRLGPTQTFVLIGFISLLVWSTAMAALIVNDKGVQALVFFSTGVVIQQGVTVP